MTELTCAQRLRTLNAIRRTIANDTRQVIPPRSLAALAASGAAFVLILLLPLGGIWRLLGALAAAGAAFYLVHARSTFAASWRERLDAQLAARAPAQAADAAGAGADGADERTARAPGTIGTRAEAVRALDAVAAYFRSSEPSSPVPLFVERAKRLVGKDFLAVLEDVVPDSVDQAKNVGGVRDEAE